MNLSLHVDFEAALDKGLLVYTKEGEVDVSLPANPKETSLPPPGHPDTIPLEEEPTNAPGTLHNKQKADIADDDTLLIRDHN